MWWHTNMVMLTLVFQGVEPYHPTLVTRDWVNVDPGIPGGWTISSVVTRGWVNVGPGIPRIWTISSVLTRGWVNVGPGIPGGWTISSVVTRGWVNVGPGIQGIWTISSLVTRALVLRFLSTLQDPYFCQWQLRLHPHQLHLHQLQHMWIWWMSCTMRWSPCMTKHIGAKCSSALASSVFCANFVLVCWFDFCSYLQVH